MVARPDSDLPPGTEAPIAGIYVVMHKNPAHALPHEILISAPTVLPECHECNSVRFSLKTPLPTPMEQHEFFKVS
jgi:hypothetical protein